MKSSAETVAQYLAELPPERRQSIAAVRSTVRKHLPKGYQEVMNQGMISYQVPLSICPDTYNGKPLMYAALASQKNHMAVYLCGIYCMDNLKDRLMCAYRNAGLKPDMGASCLRFKRLDQLPLAAIGECIASADVKSFVAASQHAHRKGKK